MSASVTTTLLRSFDPTTVLVLNLCGTFVFGISGGLAGVRARLDPFGVIVLAAVVGLAGGITRDVLIGRPPATFRDWRYLAVGAQRAGEHGVTFPLLGAVACFAVRMAGIRYDLSLPPAQPE